MRAASLGMPGAGPGGQPPGAAPGSPRQQGRRCCLAPEGRMREAHPSRRPGRHPRAWPMLMAVAAAAAAAASVAPPALAQGGAPLPTPGPTLAPSPVQAPAPAPPPTASPSAPAAPAVGGAPPTRAAAPAPALTPSAAPPSPPPPLDVEEAERQALLAISQALSPILGATGLPVQRWWDAAGWGASSRPPCASPHWRFLNCSARRGRVTKISFLDTGNIVLAGELPWAAMGALQQLRGLSAPRHAITGPAFPADTPTLPSLLRLDLSSNLLTALTDQVSNLASLTLLLLHSNPRMSGPLPLGLSALGQLKGLNLASTNLTGPMPPQWAALSSLKVLSLSGVALSSSLPDAISSFSSLSYMSLQGSALSGPLPSWVSGLTNLASLDLRYNALSGSIPRSWRFLEELTELRLDANQLSGSFPGWAWSIQLADNTSALSLGDNLFYGPVPPFMWDWGGFLNISGNFFQGKVPPTPLPFLLYFDENCFSNTAVNPSVPPQRTPEDCSQFYQSIGAPPPAAPPPPAQAASVDQGLVIGLSIAAAASVLALLGVWLWCMLQRRRRRRRMGRGSNPGDENAAPAAPAAPATPATPAAPGAPGATSLEDAPAAPPLEDGGAAKVPVHRQEGEQVAEGGGEAQPISSPAPGATKQSPGMLKGQPYSLNII